MTKTTSHKPAKTTLSAAQQQSLFNTRLGDAATVTFLLRDWEKYGLSERVCYHFDLTEALSSQGNPKLIQEEGLQYDTVCGVVSLIECAPNALWHRLTKRQKRLLKSELRSFNHQAKTIHNEKKIACYEPRRLPLRLNPSTRVYFAYEVTRIAFCVDASPSMTSTFGLSSSAHDGPCCPIDRIPVMARTFFNSLIQPIAAPSMTSQTAWQPELAVSVIAVYPMGKNSETSLLVRNFKVNSIESADELADKIEEWIRGEVEMGISDRMTRKYAKNRWTMPLYTSSLRDLLEAADYALSILSSQARPCVVLATDGRSVSCDGIMDLFGDANRVDIPLIVLDVSGPESHIPKPLEPSHFSSKSASEFLTYDPGGPLTFPLHLSDDTEALFSVCRATGGCFFDSELLIEAAAGLPEQPLAGETPSTTNNNTTDNFHFIKRRFIRINGVQFYTLFSLSSLSPTFNASWGKLVPPDYIQKRLTMGMDEALETSESEQQLLFSLPPRQDNNSQKQTNDQRRVDTTAQRKNHSQVTFSTYVVSPIRIKGLLLNRIKEGYRAKQYGQSTQDPDKVYIQFTLPLEFGTVLHYELSYRAFSNHNQMTGSAHVKIELSGNTGFIQSVKNDFLRPAVQVSRPFTMVQKVSANLCNTLRWIRKEDCLQSYLCPLKWSDQLSSPETPFVRRLGSLTPLQRRRHFHIDQFDVICTGRMPYALDDVFFSEFMAIDDGEQEFIDAITSWASQTIKGCKRFVREIESSDKITAYCVLDVVQSPIATRLFTVFVETFGGSRPWDRLAVIESLKTVISNVKDVSILPKQMSPFLVGMRSEGGESTSNQSLATTSNINMDAVRHHATWDLVKDPELLPLLMKRRSEIGKYLLLQSSDTNAHFATLVWGNRDNENDDKSRDNPGDLVQYQVVVMTDKVVIDLYMESECGAFFPFRQDSCGRQFHRIVQTLRRRDQECGRALRSRTNLLRAFQPHENKEIYVSDGGGGRDDDDDETQLASVQRLLAYSSRETRKLRFFHHDSVVANDILCELTDLLLLSDAIQSRAAKLDIDTEALSAEVDAGRWFVLQFDRHTMSIIHLSLANKSGQLDNNDGNCTYRELTFFTHGISDLYSKRNDVADDDSEDDHISEYMCVTEYADVVEAAHKKNLATAVYLALRSSNASNAVVANFAPDDFALVFEVCDFVEVTNVLVAGDASKQLVSVAEASSDTATSYEDCKLTQVITEILQPVTGDEYCFYYSGKYVDEGTVAMGDDDSLSRSSSETAVNNMSVGKIEGEEELEDIRDEAGTAFTGSDDDADMTRTDATKVPILITTPIFVRFTLDGNDVSVRDLSMITVSSNLAAHISVFKDGSSLSGQRNFLQTSNMPWSHQHAASEISALLKSYVAEQTVERLRHHGPSISEVNLSIVKKCLKRVRSIVPYSIEVFFYVSKTDLMVPASAPAGGEAEVAEGFSWLNQELFNNTEIKLRKVSNNVFMVADSSEKGALRYWCFIEVKRNEGVIKARAYHPQGQTQATVVMSKVQDVVSKCVHRVNQLLLLKRLHASRTASILLLKQESIEPDDADETEKYGPLQKFQPGTFDCPVVFHTIFDLYHRCATNPGQVARKLEATVLHSFAVSNRRGVFVYKDETGAIFYMRLRAIEGELNVDGKVELLVHGVRAPGPSVTKQLRKLLQRRLLLIAVDMLSAVLTKNPHFNWKQADLDFLQSYESDWMDVEGNANTVPQELFYEYPSCVTDPCLVLFMFRQNLCGSTYFHRLHEVGYDESGSSVDPHIDDKVTSSGGLMFRFSKYDLKLYYNGSPTKLDPNFQGVSTLTDKGFQYSQKAGTGIATIELSIVRSNGEPIDDIVIGEPVGRQEGTLNVSPESLIFQKVQTLDDNNNNGKVYVRVRIIDTALDRGVLHEWVALTLNQAIVGWGIERRIERVKNGLLATVPNTDGMTYESEDSSKKVVKNRTIDNYSPGLPVLNSILESFHGMPHPAIAKVEHRGVIRSSSVSSATLEFLENSLFANIFSDSKSPTKVIESAKLDLCIIRSSRSERPRLVKLDWDKGHRKAIVTVVPKDGERAATIRDSPIDCPEYVCFYLFSEFGKGNIKSSDPPPKMYKEIVAHDGMHDKPESIRILELFKERNPEVFKRSFCFIFLVKRNWRCLWAYNWTPQLVKTVTTRLRDADKSHLEAAGQSNNLLQYRSLRMLSPSTDGIKENVGNNERDGSSSAKSSTKKDDNDDNAAKVVDNQSPSAGPTRRIRRPLVIRRPKLIGKSVEGAAQQAVTASRERASTRFRGVTPSSTQTKRPGANTRDRSKMAGRTSVASNDASRTDLVRSKNALKDQGPRDESLAKIMRQLSMLVTAKIGRMLLPKTIHMESLQMLTHAWWPKAANQRIPQSVGEFLVSRAPTAWSDACTLPPLPNGITESFSSHFAAWIAAWIPGLELLPVTVQPSSSPKNSILLTSDVKNVRGCKCFAVVRIWTVQRKIRSMTRTFARTEGYILTLPRRSKTRQIQTMDSNATSAALMEKDSAGMDKLTSDIHGNLVLPCLLFDFSASLVERAIRFSEKSGVQHDELIPMLRALQARYPLDHQKLMPRLNYRVFEATIVLKSYNNKLINLYDAPTLFERLTSNAGDSGMVQCGAGLGLKKGINISGTHSICFLTLHATEKAKMQIVILCRTQGRNLSDFMFREGSNVAIRILDNIAVEAAGLAYKELLSAAKSLRRDYFWSSFSATGSGPRGRPPKSGILEMLNLVFTKPLLQLIGSNTGENLQEIAALLGRDVGINWKLFCSELKSDETFSTNWSLEGDHGEMLHLFYLKEEDLFWLVSVDERPTEQSGDRGNLLRIALVEKDDRVTVERRQMAIQKFANFLLHYVLQFL